MSAAEFEYTDDGDAAASGRDMDSSSARSKEEPDCHFPDFAMVSSAPSMLSERHSSFEHTETAAIDFQSLTNAPQESDLIREVRRRTFSHWLHPTAPSSVQMIGAGFFYCNVKDRVICLYCNLICQQWTSETDDPCEVHRILSPNCPYIRGELVDPSTSIAFILSNYSPTPTDLQPLQSNEIDSTAACHPAYTEMPKRHATFATCSHENLPSVDDLVRAGFFYTGTKTNVVACFYCSGSLQNWRSSDNPLIEHARWFPHCAYAKQLCGDEMYRRIQESKRAQHEGATVNDAMTNANPRTTSRQLWIPDESTLSRLVIARLNLPISEHLFDQNFQLSIIKRCWEDQFRLKQDDFVAEIDLYIACLILQKQIEHVDGKKEKIVIPRFRMKYICEAADRKRYETNFIEERTKQSDEKKSLKDWPHTFPSRIDTLIGGWSLDTTKGRDFTICVHCGVECDHWEPNDNPLLIHAEWSPCCPYILSEHPLHFSSVPIKTLQELFTKDKINSDINQSTSCLIPTSTSPYSVPPTREKTFDGFPGGPPSNVEALVKSGFYYAGDSTRMKCYHCGGTADDLHRCSSNEIGNRHRTEFPHCRFARLISRQGEIRSTYNNDLCRWCLVNPKN